MHVSYYTLPGIDNEFQEHAWVMLSWCVCILIDFATVAVESPCIKIPVYFPQCKQNNKMEHIFEYQ